MPRGRGLLLRQGRMLHALHYLYRLSYANLKNRRITGTIILRKAYRSPSCKVFRQLKIDSGRRKQQLEHNSNAQTIRPINRSPRSAPGVISKSPSRNIAPIVEDEDDEWQEKFADLKTKTSVRRGLFHPNDIKTVGLAPVSPSVKWAPLPDVLTRRVECNKTSPHTVAPTEPGHPVVGIPFTGPAGTRSHSRSPSFTGSSSGSFGRLDVRRAVINS
ncbi:hypothetical protein BJV77DRAFT_965707, partial [Russula vinacea]